MTTPSSSPHFDLNGVLKLQQKYALDLTKIPFEGSQAGINAITDLNTKLNTMSDNVKGSQVAANSVLYKQKLVNDILDTEKKRLDAKKANIDTAMQGQKRMIALNNNYQKRYAAYTKIMIAITVGLVIYIFMDKLMALMPFIPEIVFYLIVIIILGGIIFYCYLVWIDIKRRELTNFDELALPAPDLSGIPSASSGEDANKANKTKSATGSSDNQDTYNGCIGQDCCGFDKQGQPIPWSSEYGCGFEETS